MSTPLRLLLIEDVPADAELIAREFARQDIECDCRRVDTEQDLVRELANHRPDVIISDFRLPRFDGWLALKICRLRAPDVPFLFYSGTIGEEAALESLRRGAMDYVHKNNIARLVPAVERIRHEMQLRIEHRLSSQQQQEQQARFLRLNRVLQMVSGVNGALVRLRDRDSLLSETCRLAVSVGEYAFATVWIIEPGGVLRSVVKAGPLDLGFDDINMRITGSDDIDPSMTARAIRTRQPVVAPDIMNSVIPVMNCDVLRAAGVRGIVALPLLVDGNSVGALVLGTSVANQLDEQELDLLREVAANLSFALQYLQREGAVHFLSHFDALTGLAKRRLFYDRLDRQIAATAGQQISMAIIVFDIERLGVVNDSAGRHVGDMLLQQIAERLRQQVTDTDYLGYLGGGIFCAAVPLRGSPNHAFAGLHERGAAMFSQPFEIEGHSIRTLARAGISRYPEDGGKALALVENAEAALKTAKSTGERLLPFRMEMQRVPDKRLELETRLRIAIEKRQFVLHYQPKVDIASGKLTGLEALIRWQDPDRGLISPLEFLPILESTQMIVEVGARVIDQALQDLRRWHDAGIKTRVAVNVSPWQLRRGDFAEKVLARMSEGGPSAGGLDLEITESALLHDPEAAMRNLTMLRAAGVGVAIDDFGTGYSSLSRLSMLPVNTLKIDRSFVSGLPDNKVSLSLVSTIIALARTFRLVTVAEGVETTAQLETLRQLGCAQSQGYLHGKPQPYEEITARLIAESAAMNAEVNAVEHPRRLKRQH